MAWEEPCGFLMAVRNQSVYSGGDSQAGKDGQRQPAVLSGGLAPPRGVPFQVLQEASND